MSESKNLQLNTLVTTPYSTKDFCQDFNIRTLAEAEKALDNVNVLYPQSRQYDPSYYGEDAEFSAQYFKEVAEKTSEKFKNGEYPLKEWEEDDDDYPQPNIALPEKTRDDSPTGEGNTIGQIVGQAPQGANPPLMWFNDFGHRYRGDILTSTIQQVT